MAIEHDKIYLICSIIAVHIFFFYLATANKTGLDTMGQRQSPGIYIFKNQLKDFLCVYKWVCQDIWKYLILCNLENLIFQLKLNTDYYLKNGIWEIWLIRLIEVLLIFLKLMKFCGSTELLRVIISNSLSYEKYWDFYSFLATMYYANNFRYCLYAELQSKN